MVTQFAKRISRLLQNMQNMWRKTNFKKKCICTPHNSLVSPCHTLTPNYHQRKNALKRTSKSDSLTAQCTWLHAVMAKIVPIHMCFPLYRSSSSRVYMQNAVNMDFQQIISGISCSCRYRTCLKCMENVANVASVKCVCVLLPHLLHPPCVPMSQPYVMRRPNNICTTAQRVHCTQILANLYASVHRKISASNINYCRNSMMTISMSDERRRALILYVVLLMSIVSWVVCEIVICVHHIMCCDSKWAFVCVVWQFRTAIDNCLWCTKARCHDPIWFLPTTISFLERRTHNKTSIPECLHLNPNFIVILKIEFSCCLQQNDWLLVRRYCIIVSVVVCCWWRRQTAPHAEANKTKLLLPVVLRIYRLCSSGTQWAT